MSSKQQEEEEGEEEEGGGGEKEKKKKKSKDKNKKNKNHDRRNSNNAKEKHMERRTIMNTTKMSFFDSRLLPTPQVFAQVCSALHYIHAQWGPEASQCFLFSLSYRQYDGYQERIQDGHRVLYRACKMALLISLRTYGSTGELPYCSGRG